MGYDFSVSLQWLAKLLVPLGIIGKATDFTNVFYLNAKGVTLHAYLKYPPNFDSTQTYPAALVLHSWNGMSEEPLYFADLLSEQGYIVLAPDLFRNVATCETNIPWNIWTVSTTPQERIDEDVDAALNYLTHTIGNVDKSRVFSGPGFCFGGTQAVTLSIRRPMAGTISLYGAGIDMLQDGTKDKKWANLGADKTEVLGIYGGDDNRPSPETALGFESAMTLRGISNTVTIYEGVSHAFVNPVDHSNGEQQAVDAWDQVLDFMNTAAGVSRRILDVSEAPAQLDYHQLSRSSLSWMWDHAMDFFYDKGHFGHGSEHRSKHAAHSDPAAEKAPEKMETLDGDATTGHLSETRSQHQGNHEPNVRVGGAA